MLEQSSQTTTRTEDRGRYQQHLAVTAQLFIALRGNRPLAGLKELLASETRSYGWDYLDGDAGQAAERTFEYFNKSVIRW